MKILSIDKEKFKYTFFIFEKDEGRLELLMKLDFHFLKDRISYVIVPSYVTRLELFIRYIVENKDELNRLQRTVNC